jgi:hypothetical protein
LTYNFDLFRDYYLKECLLVFHHALCRIKFSLK